MFPNIQENMTVTVTRVTNLNSRAWSFFFNFRAGFLISFLILLFSDGTKEKVEDVENAGGES